MDAFMDICMDISISIKHTSIKSMKQVCNKHEIMSATQHVSLNGQLFPA